MSEYEISSDWYYKKYYEAYDEPENSGDDFDDFDTLGEDEIKKKKWREHLNQFQNMGFMLTHLKGG